MTNQPLRSFYVSQVQKLKNGGLRAAFVELEPAKAQKKRKLHLQMTAARDEMHADHPKFVETARNLAPYSGNFNHAQAEFMADARSFVLPLIAARDAIKGIKHTYEYENGALPALDLADVLA